MVSASALLREWGVAAAPLPPLGASPDALVYHPESATACAPHVSGDSAAQMLPRSLGAAAAAGVRRAAGEQPAGDASDEEVVFQPPGAAAEERPAGAGCACQSAESTAVNTSGWLAAVQSKHALPGQWEVVEVRNLRRPAHSAHCAHFNLRLTPLALQVKNHSPFAYRSRPSLSAARRTGTWLVADSGPRVGVPVQYMPQLQIEMLATGLRSALFVSRSATLGTNVFRVWRDDTYCMNMVRKG